MFCNYYWEEQPTDTTPQKRLGKPLVPSIVFIENETKYHALTVGDNYLFTITFVNPTDDMCFQVIRPDGTVVSNFTLPGEGLLETLSNSGNQPITSNLRLASHMNDLYITAGDSQLYVVRLNEKLEFEGFFFRFAMQMNISDVFVNCSQLYICDLCYDCTYLTATGVLPTIYNPIIVEGRAQDWVEKGHKRQERNLSQLIQEFQKSVIESDIALNLNIPLDIINVVFQFWTAFKVNPIKRLHHSTQQTD